MAVQWSALPGDILSAIARLLNSDVDLLRLRSVCSSWRSSLSPPPQKPICFPLTVPPLSAPFDWCSPNGRNGYFVLNQNTLYRLSPPASGAGDPSCGWLFKVSEINANTFSLLNPFSTEKIKDSYAIMPKRLNLLDYRISEVCKSYSLDFVDLEESSEQSRPFIIRKVIALWNYVVGCDLVVLVLRYGGGMDFWKFGDEDWTPIDTEGHHFHDVVLCDGKCYAIGSTGVLVSIDSKLNLTVFASSLGCLPHQKNYLVECKSDLYVVSKISSPEPEFYFDYAEQMPIMDFSTIHMPLKLKIFKVCNDWDYTGNLGDKIFLLGDDVSHGVSAKDFAGCKGNCVYLTDECFYDDGMGSVYGDDTGIYDLDDRRVEALAIAQDDAKIFWPPPSWLMPSASSFEC